MIKDTSSDVAALPPSDKDPVVLTQDQQRIIDELVAIQASSRNRAGNPQSDGEFAKRLGISAPQWNLIRNGSYWKSIKNVNAKLIEMREHLNRLKQENNLKKRFEGLQFHTADVFEAMFMAIEECRQKGLSDTTRICVYLAETGGGKSFLGHEVVQRFDGIYVEARQAWAYGSFHALKDICEAFQIDTSKIKQQPAKLENLLLNRLALRENPVLYIDEGEFFGKGIIDSLKHLINKTTIVPVIAAIPEYYAKWNTYWPTEAAQLRRRTHIVVQNNVIDPIHVEKFILSADLPIQRDNVSKAAIEIASHAQRFGAYDLTSKVVRRLKAESKINAQIITAAIHTELKCMGADVVLQKGGGK